MPLHIFKRLGLDARKIHGDSVSILGFGENHQWTTGNALVELKVGPLRSLQKFHVIDAHPSYHLLLGRPWIHHHKAIPSSYYQCIKASTKNSMVTIRATQSPFAENESYLAEAEFYTRWAQEGETISNINSIKLPYRWELDGKGKEKVEEAADTDRIQDIPESSKRKAREDPLYEKIVRDGKVIYRL
jgi:hypothetical protein